jgi:transglutaminase-like putative cysteine protease
MTATRPVLDSRPVVPDGTPSVVFAEPSMPASPSSALTGVAASRPRPGDEARYLGLPTDLDPDIFALASATTRGLQTDFEKALALESFFLTPGNFRYSTDILPGHAASDLAAWLLDRNSDNFRTGYCEQFATEMAVMARLLEIPKPGQPASPGTVLTTASG